MKRERERERERDRETERQRDRKRERQTDKQSKTNTDCGKNGRKSFTQKERMMYLIGSCSSQLTQNNSDVRRLAGINGLPQPLSCKLTTSFSTASGTKEKPASETGPAVAGPFHGSRVRITKPNHSTHSAIKTCKYRTERERRGQGG